MSDVVDHVGLKVADFERALGFYREALATLGIDLLADFTVGRDRHAGFGRGRPSFWISSGKTSRGDAHVAFTAASRAEVEAFHAVALSLGGRDNGPPGLRAHYHPDYFGAFVLDPDGHNIEAVYHGAE
ncbi:MAG TPA: VOC family protein [Devosiaceae bacterium]|jgi:catechol 2,3-dioxygenase-like lactoylglutathione lyase family enzyme|nr:VOC family protein [Devosiaceae bacterium]